MRARIAIRFRPGVLDPEATAIQRSLHGLGFTDDAILRTQGIKLVDGRMPGFAACVGKSVSREELASVIERAMGGEGTRVAEPQRVHAASASNRSRSTATMSRRCTQPPARWSMRTATFSTCTAAPACSWSRPRARRASAIS